MTYSQDRKNVGLTFGNFDFFSQAYGLLNKLTVLMYTVPVAVSKDEARLLGRVKLNGNSCLPIGRLGPLNGIIS